MKLWKKSKISKILLFVIPLILSFFVKTEYVKLEGLNEIKFVIKFYKWEIFYLIKKKDKIVTLLIFGCGFQILGEFKRWFVFWNEVNNNELEVLEK